MSKDTAISEIVKNLHTLNLEENEQILKFIKSKQELKADKNKEKTPIHVDRDGTELRVGDEVYLLTKGVYNIVGEKGSVEHLPKTVGDFITFRRNRIEENEVYNTYISKKGRSVRKVPCKDDK